MTARGVVDKVGSTWTNDGTLPGGGGGGGTITVQEGDVDVDTAVTTLDFDASDFNVTSSPAGEANIALAYGTSAGTPAEGNHTHTPATQTIAVQEQDSTVDAAAQTLDFDGAHFDVTSEAGNEVRIAVSTMLALLAALSDPNADRLLFWDDSAGALAWLTAGTGLSLSGTTLSATGGGGGGGLGDAPLPAIVTGQYYAPYDGMTLGSIANQLPGADTLVAVPFRLGADATFDRIGVNVTANVAAQTIRLGIYAADGAGGMPGTLILDAGTVSAATTGAKEITISQALGAGRCYLALAATHASVGVSAMSTSGVHAVGMTGVADNTVRRNIFSALSPGFSALPDPFPSSPSFGSNLYLVKLRAV